MNNFPKLWITTLNRNKLHLINKIGKLLNLLLSDAAFRPCRVAAIKTATDKKLK